jgi:hypothetical protein
MGMHNLWGQWMSDTDKEIVKMVNPTLLLKGAFGIWETPDGGIHLVFKLDGQDEDKHMEFTPFMLKAMQMAFPGKGNPLQMLRLNRDNPSE